MAAHWFKKYAADYLSDSKILVLSFEQRGILETLWCFAWKDGGIPADQAQLARLLGLTPKAMRTHSGWIARFFQPHPEDATLLISPRLELERAEADSKGAKARESASIRWSKRNANASKTHDGKQCESNASSMLSESESESEKEKKYPLTPKGEPSRPKRKRRSHEEILSAHGEEVRKVVQELTPAWPEFHDPAREKPIRLNRALFAERVAKIIASHPNANADLLISAGWEYLHREGSDLWWKNPEFFFGPEGPWLAFAKDLLTVQALQVTA